MSNLKTDVLIIGSGLAGASAAMAAAAQGKNVIITGASRGIGRAIAFAMAEEGAKVALTGRDTGRLNKVMEQIQLVGGQSNIWKMDVSSETEVEDSVN